MSATTRRDRPPVARSCRASLHVAEQILTRNFMTRIRGARCGRTRVTTCLQTMSPQRGAVGTVITKSAPESSLPETTHAHRNAWSLDALHPRPDPRGRIFSGLWRSADQCGRSHPSVNPNLDRDPYTTIPGHPSVNPNLDRDPYTTIPGHPHAASTDAHSCRKGR